MREGVRSALQKCFPGAAITVITDLEAALAAAGEGAAIILVAGTGSAAYGRNAAGEIARSGGYGRFTSDEGSAFDIGRRAIAAAMQERSSEGDSVLGREILAELGCTEWGVLQHRALTMPDEVFPPVFRVVAAAADAGDAPAQEVLVRASQDLVKLVVDVVNQLHLTEREFLLVKMGGTMRRSRFFDAEIDAALQKAIPHARMGVLRVSPAEAAALVAKESDAG